MNFADDLDRYETIKEVISDQLYRKRIFSSNLLGPTLPLTEMTSDPTNQFIRAVEDFLINDVTWILFRQCRELLVGDKAPTGVILAACRDILINLSPSKKKDLARRSYDPEHSFDEETEGDSDKLIKSHRYSRLIRAIENQQELPKVDSNGFPHIALPEQLRTGATVYELAEFEFDCWLLSALPSAIDHLPKLDYFSHGKLRPGEASSAINQLLSEARRPLADTVKESLSAVKVVSKRSPSQRNKNNKAAWEKIFKAYDKNKSGQKPQSARLFYRRVAVPIIEDCGAQLSEATVCNRLAERETKKRRQFTPKQSKRR
ncbi:MAG: hypothetical protein RIS36_2143 [Pseudomonadota bacterium]|jgi:hypothetical protein